MRAGDPGSRRPYYAPLELRRARDDVVFFFFAIFCSFRCLHHQLHGFLRLHGLGTVGLRGCCWLLLLPPFMAFGAAEAAPLPSIRVRDSKGSGTCRWSERSEDGTPA